LKRQVKPKVVSWGKVQATILQESTDKSDQRLREGGEIFIALGDSIFLIYDAADIRGGYRNVVENTKRLRKMALTDTHMASFSTSLPQMIYLFEK